MSKRSRAARNLLAKFKKQGKPFKKIPARVWAEFFRDMDAVMRFYLEAK